MNYQLTEAQDWIIKINDDGTKTPSFTDKGEIGKQLWEEYQLWLAQGNTPLPYVAPVPVELTYQEKRQAEYPPYVDYLDGVVKGDQVQIDKYIADCNAIKNKYPKI